LFSIVIRRGPFTVNRLYRGLLPPIPDRKPRLQKGDVRRIENHAVDSATSWKRAVGLASLAVYGPFFIMAVFTLLFISCYHCKQTTWLLLPSGPGMLPLESARVWLNFPRLSDLPLFLLAFLIALTFVAGLAWVVRLGKKSRMISLIVAFIACSACAFGLLSAIRS
jgi:hypothetical protein